MNNVLVSSTVFNMTTNDKYTYQLEPIKALICAYYQVIWKNQNTWTYDYEKVGQIIQYSGHTAYIEIGEDTLGVKYR